MAPHGIVGISRFLCTPPRRFAYRCGRSFCANAASCHLTICILLSACPSLPLRKDPRPQRQAQHLGGVRVGSATSKQRSFCANAASCRLWVSILLPARPSLPLRKDPRPQRQAQRLGVVRVGEYYVKTAVFLCKCCVMSLVGMYTIACVPFLAFAQRSTPTAASSTPRRRASGGVLRQNSGFLVQISRHAAWQIISYSGQAYRKKTACAVFCWYPHGESNPRFRRERATS